MTEQTLQGLRAPSDRKGIKGIIFHISSAVFSKKTSRYCHGPGVVVIGGGVVRNL